MCDDDLHARPVATVDQPQRTLGVDSDLGQIDALVVRCFDAVDDRAALDGDAPAYGVDPWVPDGRPGVHVELKGDRGPHCPVAAHVEVATLRLTGYLASV